VIYNEEDDQHFPVMTVYQTLEFALLNKTKKSEKENIPIIINALLKMFGISHAAHTGKFPGESERDWENEANVYPQLLEMHSFEVYPEESENGSPLRKHSRQSPPSLVGITRLGVWMPIPRSITLNHCGL